MSGRAAAEAVAIVQFLFGALLPLLASAMVPNGYQRIGGALLALAGIGIAVGMFGIETNPIRWGLVLGMALASIKLTAGLRFL